MVYLDSRYSSPCSFAVISYSNLPRKRIFAKEHSFAVKYIVSRFFPRKNILQRFFSAKEYCFAVFPRKNILSRKKLRPRKNRVDCIFNTFVESLFLQKTKKGPALYLPSVLSVISRLKSISFCPVPFFADYIILSLFSKRVVFGIRSVYQYIGH